MHKGMHIRENDIYAEILHPVTHEVLKDGSWGELAVTTLTRRGMPLLRYRTGDLARFLPGSCACGSVLKRLECGGRIRENGLTVKLDEALFSIDTLVDYEPEYEPMEKTLSLKLKFMGNGFCEDQANIEMKVKRAVFGQGLNLVFERILVSYYSVDRFLDAYAGKRSIKIRGK